MASNLERPEPKWLEALSRFPREKTAYALMGAAGVLGVAAVAVVIAFGRNGAVSMAGLVFFALALAGTGLWRLTTDPETMPDRDATRILVLLVGGFLGLTLAAVALALIVQWRDMFTGGAEVLSGPNAKWVWLCVALELVGLAVMFISLQVARTEERTNAVLRRLLYGYNAVLAGILLLALLAAVNILCYLYLPASSDWTASGMYTLSQRSQNILEGLDKPLRVYVVQGNRDSALFHDVRTLLDNCQRYTNKLQVEYLYRDYDPERIEELIRRYQFVGLDGLLVVYGSPPDENNQFIRREDLQEIAGQDFTQEKPRWEFKGEDALMTAITFLEEGKSKPVVYFTQGNGELDITDTQSTQVDEGAGQLRDRLQKANYEVKGLRLSPVGTGRSEPGKAVVTVKQVPDDAALVVVAGPRRKLTPEAVVALHDYMSKPAGPKKTKGKLVVLLDVVTSPEHRMVQTGLEDLLAEFNVRVGNDQVMAPQMRNPLVVQVTANPQLRDSNPVAAAFAGKVFPLYNVRTVRPITANAPGRSGYQAQMLLAVIDDAAYAEESFPDDPRAFNQDLVQNHLKELQAKISPDPLPVGVAVAEPSSSPAMMNPHRPRKPSSDEVPRLLVIGDASFVCNRALRGESRSPEYELFASCLAWLRERPNNIGIEPKKRGVYQLNEGTNVARMIWLPLGLMSFAVVGVGLGVWVVRRR